MSYLRDAFDLTRVDCESYESMYKEFGMFSSEAMYRGVSEAVKHGILRWCGYLRYWEEVI